MTTSPRVAAFTAALQRSEQDGVAGSMADVSAPSAELHRPEMTHAPSSGGDVEKLWTGYFAPFDAIRVAEFATYFDTAAFTRH